MTFMLLNAVFIAVSVVVYVVALRVRPHARPSGRAVAISVLALFVMTAVFDNVMIAADLFDYDPDQRLGILLWRAPIEDFAYPLAGALLLPALWHLLGAARTPPGGQAAQPGGDRTAGR